MTGLLEGKRLLITGVITDSSIGFHVARKAQEEGATVVLTGYGRLSLVERIAGRLPTPAPVVELDVTDQEHLATLAERVGQHVDGLDGVLHSIGYAPPSCLGGGFLDAPWEDVATAMHTSAYSLKSLTTALMPLLAERSSVVGMDFDARQAWPVYDWMGVAKAALESTNRYLARDLGGRGVRVNLVSAGPLKTMAAKSIPGFEGLADAWTSRAPLGWDVTDPEPVARTVCAMLSDWLPSTTGSIVMADGGFHAVGV
ncbi:enoyl-[acyl-carrier-protein] reductase FabI [Actinoalloteichus sp. AHMU CJ021]|uniref:Enoyl-[acyl-carrier-protein] reductase [NADH] n=2 Tax=Actinoalloteichus cyanogriseus TaxID=2893586 RepID=A0ABT1JBT6_ACTCY|nr:enoyl-ACP reductase FabI [Actinoalloteichus caeruleus]AUS80585.1 enoyl-[acyl-carrier-protein] reductase FabI [Actinoalloteichus sp. AHMU CJ021]MCP2329962.1 Enoyl-[acyl-carrier-protein] reductase [NADH] [Actinoalloteichus caeruleus DSM 43889]